MRFSNDKLILNKIFIFDVSGTRIESSKKREPRLEILALVHDDDDDDDLCLLCFYRRSYRWTQSLDK